VCLYRDKEFSLSFADDSHLQKKKPITPTAYKQNGEIVGGNDKMASRLRSQSE
jgi:hypothetical protein